MRKFFITFFILIVLFVLYGMFIHPQELAIKEFSIYSEQITEGFDGFKIAHFSDLLLGSTQTIDNLKQEVKSINEMEADIVVFTGDLINSNYSISNEEKQQIKDVLLSIEVNLYKYAIIGDNDQKDLALYKEIMSEAEFQILDDEATYLFYKDQTPIEIIGLTDTNNYSKIKPKETDITPSYKILLTHYPDSIDDITINDFNLVLAGHSLNGQIRIPFIGGIIKKDGAYKYIDSHYKIDDTEVYIPSGLGTEKYKFRIFNKPTINKYRLYKTNEN